MRTMRRSALSLVLAIAVMAIAASSAAAGYNTNLPHGDANPENWSSVGVSSLQGGDPCDVEASDDPVCTFASSQQPWTVVGWTEIPSNCQGEWDGYVLADGRVVTTGLTLDGVSYTWCDWFGDANPAVTPWQGASGSMASIICRHVPTGETWIRWDHAWGAPSYYGATYGEVLGETGEEGLLATAAKFGDGSTLTDWFGLMFDYDTKHRVTFPFAGDTEEAAFAVTAGESPCGWAELI